MTWTYIWGQSGNFENDDDYCAQSVGNEWKQLTTPDSSAVKKFVDIQRSRQLFKEGAISIWLDRNGALALRLPLQDRDHAERRMVLACLGDNEAGSQQTTEEWVDNQIVCLKEGVSRVERVVEDRTWEDLKELLTRVHGHRHNGIRRIQNGFDDTKSFSCLLVGVALGLLALAILKFLRR